MIRTPVISFVVPVYNAENYIERCIDSLLNQTFKDFELIIVDDGSTDSSAFICENIAINYTDISFFSKENEGVTSARLFGLRQARGLYVCFVDSDDTMPLNAVEQLLNKSDNGELDLVIGASKHINVDGNYFFLPSSINEKIDKVKYIKILLSGKHNGLPAKIIKRSCLQEELFESLSSDIKLNEDFLINIFIASRINGIGLYEDLYVYDYYIHSASTSRTIIQAPYIWFSIMSKCEDNLKTNCIIKEVSFELACYKLRTIFHHILMKQQNMMRGEPFIINLLDECKKHKFNIKYSLIQIMLKYSGISFILIPFITILENTKRLLYRE